MASVLRISWNLYEISSKLKKISRKLKKILENSRIFFKTQANRQNHLFTFAELWQKEKPGLWLERLASQGFLFFKRERLHFSSFSFTLMPFCRILIRCEKKSCIFPRNSTINKLPITIKARRTLLISQYGILPILLLNI